MLKTNSDPVDKNELTNSLVEFALEKRRLPKLPWLFILDMIGLFLAILLVAWQIGDGLVQQPIRVFVMLLLVFGFNTRVFLGHMKSIETLLNKTRLILLLAPLFAAISTVTVQALSRSYYSGMAIIIFVMFWTIWLFIARKIYYYNSRALNMLLISPANFKPEFDTVDNLNLSVRIDPPKDFSNWDVAIIDPSEQYSTDWLQWLSHADMYGVRTISAPLVIETLTSRIPLDMLHGRWAFEILKGDSSYRIAKRVLDLSATILASPFILLLSIIVAIIIKLDDGGPILFWQERIGLNGKPFQIVKFRTMRTNAEENGAAFASKNDSRITKIGPFMRKFRVDEVPQFWNVLKGEMSIIGPRPEQKAFAAQFAEEIPLYNLRHNVRPGITGWAQTVYGYAADSDETREKLCHDFYYVKHFSLELDVRVVYHTIITILTGFGAR